MTINHKRTWHIQLSDMPAYCLRFVGPLSLSVRYGTRVIVSQKIVMAKCTDIYRDGAKNGSLYKRMANTFARMHVGAYFDVKTCLPVFIE